MILGHQFELHKNISGYLERSASLADVETRVWSFLGDLENDEDEAARNAAGAIGSLISEYSYGDRSEESLRRELAAAIRPFEKCVANGRRALSSLKYMPFDFSDYVHPNPRPKRLGAVRIETFDLGETHAEAA